MQVVRVSAKGQVVIPKRVREELGIREGDACQVEVREGAVVLRPLRGAAHWRRWRGALAGMGALGKHLAEHRREVESEGGGP
jgi:AbrB family looped-hinge helix DNA binding protein